MLLILVILARACSAATIPEDPWHEITCNNYAVLEKLQSFSPMKTYQIPIQTELKVFSNNWKEAEKKYTKVLKNWSETPGEDKFSKVEWLESNPTFPDTYVALATVKNLEDIVQTCHKHGLKDLDLDLLSDAQKREILLVQCPDPEPEKYQTMKEYYDACQKAAEDDPRATIQSCEETWNDTLDITKKEYFDAKYCGVYFNYHNLSHPDLRKTLRNEENTGRLKLATEKIFEETMGDLKNFPKILGHKDYPGDPAPELHCNQLLSIPNHNGQQATENPRCHLRPADTHIYCMDPRTNLKKESSQKFNFNNFKLQWQMLAGHVKDLITFKRELEDEEIPDETLTGISLGTTTEWSQLEKQLDLLVEEKDFGTLAVETLESTIAIVKKITSTTREDNVMMKLTDKEAMEVILQKQYDTLKDDNILYLEEEVELSLIGTIAGDIIVGHLNILVATTDTSGKIDVFKMRPINVNGFLITDKYMLREWKNGYGHVATYPTDPLAGRTCFMLQKGDERGRVCRDYEAILNAGDKLCGVDLYNDPKDHPRCRHEKTNKPTITYKDCEDGGTKIVAPEYTILQQQCHTAVGAYDASDFAVPQGSTPLSGTCKLQYKGKDIFAGGNLPQKEHSPFVKLEETMIYYLKETMVTIQAGIVMTVILLISILTITIRRLLHSNSQGNMVIATKACGRACQNLMYCTCNSGPNGEFTDVQRRGSQDSTYSTDKKSMLSNPAVAAFTQGIQEGGSRRSSTIGQDFPSKDDSGLQTGERQPFTNYDTI